MRKFKFSDDKSYKFWNIELQDSSFTVAYGRIGTNGQTQTKKFPKAEKAQKEYDKLITEKLGKGYIEITPPSAGMGTQQVLEKAILEDPNDLAAHAAYADWLSQQSDPRGEFIQVQLALEDPKLSAAERIKLKEREDALLKEHGAKWVGEWGSLLGENLAPESGQALPAFRFIRGILAEVNIGELTLASAQAFVRSTETRLVTRLSVGDFGYEEGAGGDDEGDEDGEDGEEDAAFPSRRVLPRWPFFENLRLFRLGEPMEGDYSNCHTSGARAASLVARMPKLEEIYLLAHRVDMEKLFRLKTLNNLRILQIYHNHAYPLEILAGNPAFANLTHLLLYPHALEPDDEEPYITQAGVRSLLRSKHLKKLTHLQLRLSDLGDVGCADLVASGLLGQLKMLDLMHGRITDDGARTLAGCPGLKNLELLEVSHNLLTQTGIQALQATGIKVQAGEQYTAGNEDLEYLYMGDME